MLDVVLLVLDSLLECHGSVAVRDVRRVVDLARLAQVSVLGMNRFGWSDALDKRERLVVGGNGVLGNDLWHG